MQLFSALSMLFLINESKSISQPFSALSKSGGRAVIFWCFPMRQSAKAIVASAGNGMIVDQREIDIFKIETQG